MFTKKSILLLFSVLCGLLLLSGTATARTPGAATSTIFTYQGRLTVGGTPADGTFDFEFRLYDDSTGETQLGSPQDVSDVPVAKGLFTVQLDFGPVFDGSMHYLEISVRAGGSSEAYTILSPRQALTAAPSAIYAASAPWSGLTGIPADFVDGVDKDTTYTAGDGLALDGTQFMGKGTSYENVIIVAKSGGDYDSIQAAIISIGVDSEPASVTNPYLVYVAPGVYSEQVTMKKYVDIQGAGELATKIKYIGSTTLSGADNAELRFLTVENTGGAAIYNDNASPRLTHVTATTSAVGGLENEEIYGVKNINLSSPKMTNMTISASGAGYNHYGVHNNYDSSPTMTNVTISVSGGSNHNVGVENLSSSATLTNVTVTASGGTENYGIYNLATTTSTYTVLVDNSKITVPEIDNTIYNADGVVKIGASQLSGGPISGTATCIGVYDEDYAITNYNACP